MKPNVDLTENRLFTTFEKRESSELETFLIKSLKLKIPWREFQTVSSDAEFREACVVKKSSLFPTGNKKDRQQKMKNSMYHEKRCEECGKILPKCPWIKHECGAYFMGMTKKIPWIF